MIIFNCIPDSVSAYSISEVVIWEHDRKLPQWTINIWWSDGRESELTTQNREDMESVASKLERTVRQPPAVSGFIVADED